MTKLQAPRFLDVIEAVSKAGAVRVNDIADATGCEYGPSKRVLDLLAYEGLILKVMRGERTFEYAPTPTADGWDADTDAMATKTARAAVVEDIAHEARQTTADLLSETDALIGEVDEFINEAEVPRNVGEREDDYPEDWLSAKAEVFDDVKAPDIDYAIGVSIAPAPDDPNVYEVRVCGRKLGEVAELDLKDRARYQIVSPWEPKTFDRMSKAISSLDKPSE
jgi:hypothetical protein